MRRLLTVFLVAASLLLTVSCKTPRYEPVETQRFNAALMRAYTDTAINNALIAQHTIYPYAFVENSVRLNQLGEHDVKVLAEHFKNNPGPLSIRRENTPSELYDARVKEVMRVLSEAGVAMDRMNVNESLPGGEGMPTDRVVEINAPQAPRAAETLTILSPMGAE